MIILCGRRGREAKEVLSPYYFCAMSIDFCSLANITVNLLDQKNLNKLNLILLVTIVTFSISFNVIKVFTISMRNNLTLKF